MPNFKTQELEDLSKQILDRAVRQQQPLEARPLLVQRLRDLAKRRRQELPRLLRIK